jgi:hypothetical protein
MARAPDLKNRTMVVLAMVALESGRSPAAQQMHDQGDQKHDQEDEEQRTRDLNRDDRNAAEAENTGDQRNN